MKDTLKYAKSLEASGFSRKQAEAQVNILCEMIEDDVATKMDMQAISYDIGSTRGHLESKINGLEARIDSRINGLEARIDGRIDGLEARIDGRIDGLEGRIGGLEDKINGLRSEIEARFHHQDQNMAQMEACLENRLTIKLGAVTVGAITITMTLMGWLGQTFF